MLISQENLVSVIIPVFNDQMGINACLAALSTQRDMLEAFEVIVVDNSSTPAIQIPDTFSGIAKLVMCPTPGAYAARNAGAREAKGDILAFTDADCLPSADWLSKGTKAINATSGQCMIGGEVRFTRAPHPTAIELYQLITGFMQRENIEAFGFSATANLFVSRALFNTAGEFNELLLSGGDREWAWRAAAQGGTIKFADDVIVETAPRRSLLLAIRQARRIAGGRYRLRRLGLAHVQAGHLHPHRGVLASIAWILGHQELSIKNRTSVFTVACILKLAQLIETLRLALGTDPERR